MNKSARQKEIKKQLQAFVPNATMEDFLAMMEVATAGHLRHLPPSIAVWQSATTVARHNHTDYDALLNEGYDADSARHFVLDEINETLASWGCPRRIKNSDETQ